MEQFNLLEGSGSFNDPTIQSVHTTQAKDGGKQMGCEEKKAAVHEEIKKVNQLPAHSTYATHRMRVLNKILQLLSVQVFDKMPNPSEVGSETVSTSGVAPYVKGSYVASGSHLHIEKWNGDGDFGKWQWKMKAVLRRNRVHNVVFDLEDLDPNVSVVEKEEMEEWALTTLQLAMGENVISEVSDETTARGIWTKLEELYLNKSLTNRLILLKTFFTYKMKEGSSIKTHFTVFNDLIMKMKAIDLKIEEEQLAMILLCSLPERHTDLANSLMYGRRDTITLVDVKTSLFSEELCDQMKGLSDESKDSSNNQGLFVGRGCSDEEMEKSRGCSNSRKPSWRSKSRDRDACHYCKQPGHWLKDCPKLKKTKMESTSSMVVNNDALSTMVNSSDVGCRRVLDFDAPFHMTPNRNCFFTFVANEENNILMGNDNACRCMGIGSVRIRMFNGIVRIIANVRYVPSMTKSLISIEQLISRGCKVKFERDVVRVSRSMVVLIKGEKAPNNLCYLIGHTVTGNAN